MHTAASDAGPRIPSRVDKNVLPAFAGLLEGQQTSVEINVAEQNGSIELSMTHLQGERRDRAQVFMTPDQGHDLLRALLEAIDQAERRRSLRQLN